MTGEDVVSSRISKKSILSLILPLFLVFLLIPYVFYFRNIELKYLINGIGLLTGFVYVGLRARIGTMLPATKLWPWVLGVYIYFTFSLFISGNIYVGIPRLLNLVALGVFFILVWDGFDDFFDRESVINGLLVVTFAYMSIAITQVWIAYSDWWAIFGIGGEDPPVLFRFTLPLHSNQLMAILNLFFPIVIILFMQSKTIRQRIVYSCWLVFFGIVLVFSSSRGGMVGLFFSLTLLIVLNINFRNLADKFRAYPGNAKRFIFVALLVILLLAIYAGGIFLTKISSHPTHGGETGGINLNRESIWLGVWRIFTFRPIMGVGIGKYFLGFFNSNRHVPPAWYPVHAHNLLLGFLAEFGIVGTALFLVTILSAGMILVRRFAHYDGEWKATASAVIAGLGSLAVQSMFEDYLYHYIVFVFACILIALLATITTNGKIKRSLNHKFIWISPFLVALTVLAIWSAFPERVLGEALRSAHGSDNNWGLAAEKAEKALEISSGSPLYSTQAGHFWYRTWLKTGDITDLEYADARFGESLEKEGALSWVWVNKAVVSWNLNRREQALKEITKAIDLADLEPTYYLNLGWFLEGEGELVLARDAYDSALTTSKVYNWHNHPFWSLTDFRENVLVDWYVDNEIADRDFPLDEFITAFQEEDFIQAERIYTRQKWVRLTGTDPDLLIMRGYLLLKDDELDRAITVFEDAYRYSFLPERLYPLGFWAVQTYGVIGFYDTTVPGVLFLHENAGQFTYFKDIIARLIHKGVSDQDLCELRMLHHQALSGGEVKVDRSDLPDDTCHYQSWTSLDFP